MSVQPSPPAAPLPSASLADLGDAALRARAEPANLSASNVIPFVRPKRERDAPAIILAAADRPAPPLAPAGDRRVIAVLAGSLLLHGAVYALFDRPPVPLASVGLEVMTVEIVLGAETPAGLAQQPSESEAQPSAPAPDQTAEPEKTEVAQAEPPTPTDVAPEAAPAREPAPPEPTPSDITAPAPTPPADFAREAPPPPPEKAEPAPAKPAPPVREAARHPAAKPKPPERETGQRRPASAASAPSAASSGIGRGRSDAETNYPGLVAAHLARHKRFPAEARGRGEQGVATVRFTLDGGGRVNSVALVRPTGIASLDRESQDVVRRASPFPPPPSGKPMSFTVPVRFNLM